MKIADIDVEITRKRVKNINLSVGRDGRVRVSAPLFAREAAITAFVASKADWIKKHRERIAEIMPPLPAEYVSGTAFRFVGRQYTLETECGKRYALAFRADTAVLTVPDGDSAAKRVAFIEKWQRGELKKAIEARLPVYEKQMELKCSSWNVRQMKTRWGTCNIRTHKIWFSLRLIEKASECLDYIIVHELAHTRYGNHGAQFKQLVAAHCPNWKNIVKLLRNPR